MANQTKLQLVNRLLVRMREPSVVTTLDTDYSTMVVDYINEAKRTVEDTWDWIQLRSTIQVTTTSGTYAYTLTGLGSRGRILADEVKGGYWMDVFDDTNDQQLRRARSTAWMTRQFLTAGSVNAKPIWFDINGNTSGDPIANLYPIPDGTYTINFNCFIPQADFSTSVTTDDSTTITVPDEPVMLLAHAYLTEERGDESSAQATALYGRAQRALNDAILRETQIVPETQMLKLG